MMKVFVVFGSASDESVSLPLVAALEQDFDTEYAVLSAHRDLEKLRDRLSGWKGGAVVAGAGLAAALPGVAAAMTQAPVFGVPVPSQFGGLDSFASIAQMPPGVPVLAAGPSRPGAAVSFLKQCRAAQGAAKGGWSLVHFVMRDRALVSHPDLQAEVEKARALGRDRGLDVTLSDTETNDGFNVILAAEEGHVQPGAFCLHVPFLAKEEAKKPENYLRVLGLAEKGGLWVGANNTRNAVHAVLRLNAAQRQQGRAAA